MERERINEHALRMAEKLGALLLTVDASAEPEETTRDAASLVHDCVRYLGLVELAVDLVNRIHPLVERWANWERWALALAILSEHPTLGDRERSSVLSRLSQTARELGAYERAEAAARAALDLARAADERPGIVAALNKIGMIAYYRNDLITAHDYLAAAAEYLDPAVPQLEYGHTLQNLGLVAMHQGQYDTAIRWFEQANAMYHGVGDEVHAAKAICCVVETQRRTAQLRSVPAALYGAIETFRRAGARSDYAQGLNDLGCLLLTLEQFDEAEAALDAAVSECRAMGAERTRGFIMTNVVELYVTTGDWDRAVAAILEVRGLLELFELPLSIASVDVDEGRMYWKQGQVDRARELWRRALAVQTARGAPGAAALTRRLLELEPGAPV